MADELSELIAFLSDERPNIRTEAAQLVAGLSGTADGVTQLVELSVKLLPPLLKLLNRGPDGARILALKALVNLTAEHKFAFSALLHGATERCVDRIRDAPHCVSAWPEERALLLSLLTNLSSTERGASLLLQEGKPALEGFFLGVLLRLATAEAGAAAGAAAVTANASQRPLGRRLLAGPDGHAAALAATLSRPVAAGSDCDSAAQRGAACALRNVAVEPELHEALLREAPQVIPAFLSQLSGASCADEQLRCLCAEGLAALADSAAGRAALWAGGAVEALRKAYVSEEGPEVCAALERAAHLLITSTSDGEAASVTNELASDAAAPS